MKHLLQFFYILFIYGSTYGQQLPNFIIIYVDDMGYGDLGVTGHPTIKTPNLDNMAFQGCRYTNYYSASPACTASRYALLTGKYPPRSGFRWVLNPDSKKGIHPKELTIAELLKENGYNTAIFGKWHLGSTKKEYLPLSNGFDEYVGLPYSNDMIPPKYPDIALLNGYDTLEINPDQSKLTRLYTDKAIEFIDRKSDKPFFVYLPYAMPHVPLFASSEFLGKSKRGLYGDVVQELDYHIGRLLDFLKIRNLRDNTFVIFTSDNGPWLIKDNDGGSAGLFRDGKGSTWEGGVREPFILWGHNSIEKGSVRNEMFSSIDILPTIVELSRSSWPKNYIDGINLTSLWLGEKNEGREIFYYFGLNHHLMAVRKGRWKLHVKTYSQLGKKHFDDELPYLFDLNSDPSEKYNLASIYPDIVTELQKLIEDKRSEITKSGSFWDDEQLISREH